MLSGPKSQGAPSQGQDDHHHDKEHPPEAAQLLGSMDLLHKGAGGWRHDVHRLVSYRRKEVLAAVELVLNVVDPAISAIAQI